MSACKKGDAIRSALSMAQGNLGRLARLCAQQQTSRRMQALGKSKAEVARWKDWQAQHLQDCEVCRDLAR